MCIEDVRLGRKSGVASTVVQLLAAGTVKTLVPQNPMRTHLCIVASSNREASVAPEGVTPSANAGFPLNDTITVGADVSRINTPPLDFDIKDHGQLVMKSWSGAATDGADVFVTVIETFLEQN